jgi:hypothetical protein
MTCTTNAGADEDPGTMVATGRSGRKTTTARQTTTSRPANKTSGRGIRDG